MVDVVKDFHNRSFHEAIEPLCITTANQLGAIVQTILWLFGKEFTSVDAGFCDSSSGYLVGDEQLA